jgi:phosphatidylserine/phosphatidylglycerophosphate/cardiolipin synthase-like enzyme
VLGAGNTDVADSFSTASLVITAPEPFGAQLAYVAAARMTLGVLTELAVTARRCLVLAAPYLGEDVFDSGVLAAAIHAALDRGVLVELATTGQQVQNLAPALARRRGDGRLILYRPAANIASEDRLGSHAKFCISDGAAAYLGSANFTGPGLGGHLEMGVLLRGDLAAKIAAFWGTLKDLKVFSPM